MKEKLFQKINSKRFNSYCTELAWQLLPKHCHANFQILTHAADYSAAFLFFEQDLHMKQSVFALVALAVGISGCSGNIGTPTGENIQVRLDVLSDLQEAWDQEMLRPDIPEQIKELI